jgi:hypothetical protein
MSSTRPSVFCAIPLYPTDASGVPLRAASVRPSVSTAAGVSLNVPSQPVSMVAETLFPVHRHAVDDDRTAVIVVTERQACDNGQRWSRMFPEAQLPVWIVDFHNVPRENVVPQHTIDRRAKSAAHLFQINRNRLDVFRCRSVQAEMREFGETEFGAIGTASTHLSADPSQRKPARSRQRQRYHRRVRIGIEEHRVRALLIYRGVPDDLVVLERERDLKRLGASRAGQTGEDDESQREADVFRL